MSYDILNLAKYWARVLNIAAKYWTPIRYWTVGSILVYYYSLWRGGSKLIWLRYIELFPILIIIYTKIKNKINKYIHAIRNVDTSNLNWNISFHYNINTFSMHNVQLHVNVGWYRPFNFHFNFSQWFRKYLSHLHNYDLKSFENVVSVI